MSLVYKFLTAKSTTQHCERLLPFTTEAKSYGTNYTIRKEIPSRDGYDFLGWDTDAAADTVVWEGGDVYQTNAPLTLYAVWKPHTYTITYKENGGTGGPQPQTKTHGEELTVSSITPVREGYIFLGWSQEEHAVKNTSLS